MICCSCGKEIDINYGREYWNGIYCKKCADEMLSTPEHIKNYKRIIADLQAENAALKERLEKAVELPCKIGDTIYQTDTNGTRIFKSTVKNIIFETDGVAFDERAIGESIFLTEEAVKEKMKKLQEKNND